MLYLLLVYTNPVSEFFDVVPNSDVSKSVTSLPYLNPSLVTADVDGHPVCETAQLVTDRKSQALARPATS